MKLGTLTTILALSMVPIGCRSQELTRPKAAQIIKETVFSPTRLKTDIQAVTILKKHVIYRPENYNTLQLGIVAQFISANQIKCGMFPCYEVTLTPKGQERSKDWIVTDEGWTIPVMRKEFIEVTGIRKDAPNNVTALFTWRWVPTDDGKLMAYKTSDPQQDGRPFALFDDGWRIQQ